MIDINEDEYDTVTKEIAGRVGDIRQDDPLAMVKRQVPLEVIRTFKEDETFEIVFRMQFHVSEIVKFVKSQRK